MKKSFLDSIDVPKPCDKIWDEMQGDDTSRFCSYCEKNIYNISAMTRQETKKLLFQTDEKVCIRMEREPGGRIKTLKRQLHQITKQMPLAAGVLTASLILSGSNNAQETKFETGKITITQIANKNSKPTISGIITDSNGAVIPDIKITLRNTNDGLIKTTISNPQGVYKFKDVEASTYEVEVAENYPFKKFIYQNLVVTEDKNFDLTIVLELQSGIEVVGVVSTETVLKTEGNLMGTKITPRQIESLPINSRNLPVLGLFLGVNEVIPKKQIKTSQISFTILDQNDALVVNAQIVLKSGKLKKEFKIFTNDEGFAKLVEIPIGEYKIEVSANGFRNYKGKIKIKETIENEKKVNLKTSNVVLGVFVS